MEKNSIGKHILTENFSDTPLETNPLKFGFPFLRDCPI